MTTMTKALKDGAVYLAHDRYVCAETRCAGMTAAFTGETINGARLERMTTADVAEWATYDLGPLVCECGNVTLSPLAGSDGWPMPRG
jgi:hypothetical protein